MDTPAQQTYSQSLQEAKGHGTAFLRSTIGRHPGATGAIIGVLIVLILILSFYVVRYKGKDGFQTLRYSNLQTGSNNPHWQMGSMDAGNWGPVHRSATPLQMSHYAPGLRPGGRVSMPHQKEGLTSGASGCGADETAITYADPSGNVVTYCQSGSTLDPSTVTQATCAVPWDPTATAEAQALATVGALQHDQYGERKLQSAINSAYDSNTGLTDDQLAALAQGSDAP